jgi:hypothetical protein
LWSEGDGAVEMTGKSEKINKNQFFLKKRLEKLQNVDYIIEHETNSSCS